MSTKNNLILDLAIFGGFLVVASPALTGTSIHEWLSIAFSATIITHLLFHWTWLVKITREFFKKFIHQSRLNYVVDALFFVAMTGTVFSGLLISRDVISILGIQLGGIDRGWRTIHALLSDASVILLGIHTAFHWKWIVNSFGRYITTPLRNLLQRQASQTLAVNPVHIADEE